MRQFGEWRALYNLDPWGPWRDDARVALAASGLANVQGARCKPKDFMPKFDQKKPIRSGDQIAKEMRAWKQLYNQAHGYDAGAG
jgi:hypothetical protein